MYDFGLGLDTSPRVLTARKGSKEAAELIMAEIDGLPLSWRELVYEYGWERVARCINDGMSEDDAWVFLCAWRHKRQQEWLATSYITGRSRESFYRREVY